MELTDWIVILAVALLATAFYCRRAPARWSLENRGRRFTATRLLVQAVLALWAALLIVVRGLFVLDGLLGMRPPPHMIVAGALVLIALGCYWSIRGTKLLKPRRLFTAY
jgi:predicted metal-binding membrane protein